MVTEIPNFTIKEETESGASVITVRNTATGEFFSVIPESGARLQELLLSGGKEKFSVLKKIKNIHSQVPDDIYTNAKLSPFAGRIKAGRYDHNNVSYNVPLTFPEEGNACHGFVFDKKFEVVKTVITADHALCSLKYEYNKNVAGYPFNYALELSYILTSTDGLICKTKVINRSLSTMPLSDGWHHYFMLGDEVDRLKLKLEVSDIVEVDAKNIPTGKRTPFRDYTSPVEIGEKRFNTCFLVDGKKGKAVTQLISEDRGVTLSVWQETGMNKFNYLVVYTPPDRKSIAIEPMTSNVDSFNNGKGLIVLPPNGEFAAKCGIQIGR